MSYGYYKIIRLLLDSTIILLSYCNVDISINRPSRLYTFTSRIDLQIYFRRGKNDIPDVMGGCANANIKYIIVSIVASGEWTAFGSVPSFIPF